MRAARGAHYHSARPAQCSQAARCGAQGEASSRKTAGRHGPGSLLTGITNCHALEHNALLYTVTRCTRCQVFCETGDEIELNLCDHEPVAASIKRLVFVGLPGRGKPLVRAQQVLVFAGQELDETMCWGDVWEATGMAEGCRIELVNTGTPMVTPVWTEEPDHNAAPIAAVNMMEAPGIVQEPSNQERLVHMGFGDAMVVDALRHNEQDADRALDWLLQQTNAVVDLRASGDLRRRATHEFGVWGFVSMFAAKAKATIVPVEKPANP